MIDVRQGNTIVIDWAITTNGEELPLEGRDLTLFIESAFKKIEVVDFSVLGNHITFKFEGTEQKTCGKHTLTLYENYGKTNQAVVDVCNAFNLVSKSCMIKDNDGDISIEQLSLNGDITILYGDITNDYLRYSSQDLTNEQKQQVYQNLGIANFLSYTNENDVEL